MKSIAAPSLHLQDGATVAIVGGGPAGAFSALHLLRRARQTGLSIRVVVFERRCHPGAKDDKATTGPYSGCPQCAGGISPRLHEAIEELGITLPAEVIQSSISMITLQGNWKSIYLPVPADRPMSSVYRGNLPSGHHPLSACFDAMLLNIAVGSGAEVIGSRVIRAAYDTGGKVELSYLSGHMETLLSADFVIFAGGVNEKSHRSDALPTTITLFQQLQPAYVAPRLRKALIFELETGTEGDKTLEGELHYIESSTGKLRLDMCSVISKRGHITVTLVGTSVDESNSHQQNLNVIKDFLALPQTTRVIPIELRASVRCICNPHLVVGTAKMPFSSRIAAVGDMATSRQYKDGILSAHTMAASVVNTIIDRGIDNESLANGYGPTIAGFQKDNRYAVVIFILYRWFFTNRLLSRIIYQTFTTEKKTKSEEHREFKKIFWAISSGDRSYEDIAWSMIRPATLWLILKGGVYVTLRNWLTERFFGISWRGVPRVMTGVSKDDFEKRRGALLGERTWAISNGPRAEFECIYSVRLRTRAENVRALLAEFGEKSRPYLTPRWVKIRRIAGEPLQQGSVIEYRIFRGLLAFEVEQQPSRENLIVYKVNGGFCHDGLFCFQVESLPSGYSLLTIYLVFDYARGKGFSRRLFWGAFRHLFPEYIHDVLWNHALCKFKQVVESRDAVSSQVHI